MAEGWVQKVLEADLLYSEGFGALLLPQREAEGGCGSLGLCTELSMAVAVESVYLASYLAVPQYQIPS